MQNYHLLRPIGAGAQAVSYLVEHTKEGEKYVLKKIPFQDLTEYEKKEAQTEARVLGTLRHPHIIAYKESFLAEGCLNIVMEYASGGDLEGLIRDAPGYLDEADILKFLIQLVTALQYCHTRKVLHRDLKSENVFLTKDQIVKLGDFGISRVLKNTLEMATSVVGTPSNLSPEMIENRPYNTKSDVWALGCVLYEMCTKSKPFTGKSLGEVVAKISNPILPPLPSHYSADLQLLVSALLQEDPEKRPSPTEILCLPFLQGLAYLQQQSPMVKTPKKEAAPPEGGQQGSDLEAWLAEKRAMIDSIQALMKCSGPIRNVDGMVQDKLAADEVDKFEPRKWKPVEPTEYPEMLSSHPDVKPHPPPLPPPWHHPGTSPQHVRPTNPWTEAATPERTGSPEWVQNNRRMSGPRPSAPGFMLDPIKPAVKPPTAGEAAESGGEDMVPKKRKAAKKKAEEPPPMTAKQREELELQQKRDRLQREREQKRAQEAEREAALELQRQKNAEERKFCMEERRKVRGVEVEVAGPPPPPAPPPRLGGYRPNDQKPPLGHPALQTREALMVEIQQQVQQIRMHLNHPGGPPGPPHHFSRDADRPDPHLHRSFSAGNPRQPTEGRLYNDHDVPQPPASLDEFDRRKAQQHLENEKFRELLKAQRKHAR
eukprot:EG_transcript_5766